MTATNFQSKRKKSGQAMLLLVLVALVASLGLALSVANRSNLQQRGSVYNVQGEKAYSTAESGLDAMLEEFSNNTPNCNSMPSLDKNLDNTEYVVTSACVGNTSSDLSTDAFTLTENLPEVFYLDDKVSEIEISWSNQNGSEPAIEMNMYDTDVVPTVFQQKSYHWHNGSTFPDLINAGWDAGSGKSEVTASNDFSNINNMNVLQITARGADAQNVVVKLTPISGQTVPLQGYTITSTGIAGKSRRTIKAFYRPAHIGNMVNNIFYTPNNPEDNN